MLFASPGGDRLFIPNSLHILVFDEDYEVPEDVFAPLQVDFPLPEGRKVVALFEVENDVGTMKLADVTAYESFLKITGESLAMILDRYIEPLEEELGRPAKNEDFERGVYVLRVRALEAHIVERPEATAAALGDLREWDE